MRLTIAMGRVLLAGALGTAFTACKEDADGTADDTGGGESGASDADGSGDDVADDGVDDGADDGNCIPGGLGCVCAEGVCSGVLFCVENECVQGPEVTFEDDEVPDVLAGLRVPVSVDAEGETIQWSQTAGPAVELLVDAGTDIEIDIPADAGDGEVITLTVEASLNGVTLMDSVDITIREAIFSNVFAEVTDVEELGTTHGIDFNSQGMWVVSTEGFVSRMAPAIDDDDEPIPASFVERFDITGMPAAATFMDGERLIVANVMASEVQIVNTNTGSLTTLFDQLEDGSALGSTTVPLIQGNDGDVLVSNPVDGQVIYYDTGDPDDEDDPVPASTNLLADGFDTPTAMAFGPEGNGMLYLGVNGQVLRVPYEDGIVGMTGTYLDLGTDCGVPSAIVFDNAANMYVGCPDTNTLFVARYVGGGIEASTEVSRSWSDVGTDVSRFAGMSFGGGDFANRSLYWTNLDSGTVGVLGVGLQGQNN